MIALGLGGCFLMSWGPERPDPRAVSGPAVYIERCAGCHGDGAVTRYAASTHAARGIRCGQCHAGRNHPDFTEPVRDGKCAGCHQPEFQQTLASAHFASRARRPLDGDRTARVALRRDGFVAAAGGRRSFVGDIASAELGGRLCAACHYDEHRLGLAPVRQATFCTGCHVGRDEHYPGAADSANRCVSCHVRVGTSVTGQVVNTHRFAVPGSEGKSQ